MFETVGVDTPALEPGAPAEQDPETPAADTPFAGAGVDESAAGAPEPDFASATLAPGEPGETSAEGAAEPEEAWLGMASSDPEADLLDEAAPRPEKDKLFKAHDTPAPAEEDKLIAEAAPPPPARSLARGESPGRSMLRTEQEQPRQGSVADGFTDFRPVEAPQPTLAAAGSDLIEALPSLLPVFADLASRVDRPFGTMPEVMPPPPLRPILPPELQDEGPRPGLLARMLGRK